MSLSAKAASNVRGSHARVVAEANVTTRTELLFVAASGLNEYAEHVVEHLLELRM
jgi:hypothetical protein